MSSQCWFSTDRRRYKNTESLPQLRKQPHLYLLFILSFAAYLTHFSFIVCLSNSAGHPGLRHSVVKWEGAVWQQQRLRRQPSQRKCRPQPPTGSHQLHAHAFEVTQSLTAEHLQRRMEENWNMSLASVRSCKVLPRSLLCSSGCPHNARLSDMFRCRRVHCR